MSIRKDFHGGRTYGADPAEGAGPGIGFNFGLTIAWLKLQLGRLLKSATSPSDLKPISPGERNAPFSLLGVSEQDQHSDPSGTPVFPMANFARAHAPATKPDRRGN